MWEQIVGNVTGSHQFRKVSIFARGLAERTEDGVRVTDKGLQYLSDKGLLRVASLIASRMDKNANGPIFVDMAAVLDLLYRQIVMHVRLDGHLGTLL